MRTLMKIFRAFINVPMAVTFLFAIMIGDLWAFAPLVLLFVLDVRLSRRSCDGWKQAVSGSIRDLYGCFGLVVTASLLMDARVTWIVPAGLAALVIYKDFCTAYYLIKGRALPAKPAN